MEIKHNSFEIGNLDASQLVRNLAARSDYQHYKGINRSNINTIYQNKLQDLIAAVRIPTRHTFHCQINNQLIALCTLEKAAWDSQHFGLPIANLSLFAVDNISRSAIHELIGQVLSTAKQAGYHYISCQLPIYHLTAFNELCFHGFNLIDIKRTYAAFSASSNSYNLSRSIFKSHPYRDEDYIASRSIIENTIFPSRYSKDEFFPAAKVRSLYLKWFEQLIETPETDRVIQVFRRQDDIVAFGGLIASNRHELPDYKFLSRGLFSSTAAGTGAYPTFIRNMISEAFSKNFNIVDSSVSLDNTRACKVLERIGCDSISTTFVLGKRLNDAQSN